MTVRKASIAHPAFVAYGARTLKLEFARNAAVKACFCALGSVAVASAASVMGCGSYSTRGAGDSFVGIWSCPTLPVGARTLSISESLDDSLSVTGESDAGSLFCASDLWTYSGSTASMNSGTSCFGGATGLEVITVGSFALTVNGSSLTVNAKETLTSAADAGAQEAGAKSSGPLATVQTVTIAGRCTKD